MSQQFEHASALPDFSARRQMESREKIARPAQSYWRGVAMRFISNKRALVSLIFIVALLISCTVAPKLLALNGAAQNLNRVSESPALSRSALVVTDSYWSGPSDSQSFSVDTIQLDAVANTEYVRLYWRLTGDVTRVEIYRHILKPSSRQDLGLPLGSVLLDKHGRGFFEDKLKLEPRRYFYTLVGDGLRAPITRAVDVKPAITVDQALAQNLIEKSAAQAFIGSEISLPAHWLGTDQLGRDMLARVIEGGQTSLFIGIVAPLIAITFGVLYGALSGFVGGSLDNWLMRFADFVIALPFLLFMILIRVAMGIGPGESGVVPMLVALVALGWPASARLIRAQVLQLREQPYIQAAQLCGVSGSYLLLRHMLPNLLGLILVQLSFAVPSAIFAEAFLSFIGMGVAPPAASWGSMCNDGLNTFVSHPYQLLIPSALIAASVLAFNLLGDGLRDALDVKLEGNR